MTLLEVTPSSANHGAVIEAATELEQARYLARAYPHAERSVLLGAFDDGRCVGFLLLLLQVIGGDAGRPPVNLAGRALREGYVEAFGVLPAYRRRGIGQALQERALELCRGEGCYQLRSRSPVTSAENYALKLKLGFALHPSDENDSYYFVKVLEPKV